MSLQIDATLQHYESIAETSGRMLEAARRSDWDAVVAEEERCRGLIQALESGDAAPLSAAQLEHKGRIIRRVLSDDAEIRNLAEPWLQQLHNMIAAAGNTRKLDTSYGPQP